MGAAQIIMIFWLSLGVFVSIMEDGKPKENYSANKAIIGTTIYVALLWWGGFWG